MSPKNPLPNANSKPLPGGGPVIHNAQPAGPPSAPGKSPGKIAAPRESWGPSYNFLSAVTCGAVKHLSGSSVLQSIAAGSKWHFLGSVKISSLTPSCASHASFTACTIAGNLLE